MNAFTILEIVISLAIMSILLAMVYSIYVTVTEQLHVYNTETEKVNAHNLAQAMLKRDVYNAVRLDEEGGVVQLIQPKDTVKYVLMDQKLIRSTSSQIDTLQAIVTRLRVDKVQSAIGSSAKSLLVDYQLLGHDLQSRYYKDYGVAEDINNLFFSHGN